MNKSLPLTLLLVAAGTTIYGSDAKKSEKMLNPIEALLSNPRFTSDPDLLSKAIQTLTKYGTSVNTPDTNGQTLVMRAIAQQTDATVVINLLPHSDLTIKDKAGKDLLYLICENGSPEILHAYDKQVEESKKKINRDEINEFRQKQEEQKRLAAETARGRKSPQSEPER